MGFMHPNKGNNQTYALARIISLELMKGPRLIGLEADVLWLSSKQVLPGQQQCKRKPEEEEREACSPWPSQPLAFLFRLPRRDCVGMCLLETGL